MPRFFSWASTEPVTDNFIKLSTATLDIKKPEHFKHSNRAGLFSTKKPPLAANNILASVSGHCKWLDSALQEQASQQGNEAALLEAWQRYGTDLLKHFIGPCSVAIANLETSEVFVSTDRVGINNFYYASPAQGGIVIADTIKPIISHPGVETSISPQAVYNYVYFHMVPGPDSIYRNIQKLPPAHYLHFNNGKTEIKQYWMPEFSENTAVSMETMQAELKDLLRDIVADRVGNAGNLNVGSFLSGGLDSSTVTGFMAQASATTPTSYTIGFDAEGYDEVEYARIATKHFGTKGMEYYLTPEDIIDAVPKIAALYDEPLGNSSVIPTYYCAKFAKDNGEDILLAGDGGDELFAGNDRYAKQQVFEFYNLIPGVAQKALHASLSHSETVDKITLLRKSKSYIDQASIPLPDRLQTYNFLHRHNPEEVFSNDFLGQINSHLPLDLQHHWYHQPQSVTALNRMLYMDWHFTLAWNDLRKVSRVCNYAGIEVEYPMLDEQLIEFSCRIPSNWKLNKLRLRHFYKQSMQGFLPDTILKKPKQGFGLPFGIWAKNHNGLKELIHDNVEKLKTRGFINPEFLDTALDMHDNSHADFYGELLWVLMMLEMWMSAHENPENNNLKI
jgi:asparagine synthase (glutamine-hydrolysing)